jgi:hypothetical protein
MIKDFQIISKLGNFLSKLRKLQISTPEIFLDPHKTHFFQSNFAYKKFAGTHNAAHRANPKNRVEKISLLDYKSDWV